MGIRHPLCTLEVDHFLLRWLLLEATWIVRLSDVMLGASITLNMTPDAVRRKLITIARSMANTYSRSDVDFKSAFC